MVKMKMKLRQSKIINCICKNTTDHKQMVSVVPKLSHLFFCFVLLIFSGYHIKAQQARIVLQNSDYKTTKPAIHVKWYSQQLIYNKGVYLYRRDYPKGRWTKLTPQPLTKLADLPQEIKQKDNELNLFVEVIKGAKPEQLTGLLLMNLMVESFNNQLFSKFMGIQFDDESIVPGKTYQYKVQKVYGNEELLLAQSDSITARTFISAEAPGGYFAKIGKKKVEIGWEPEDNRFYAVNVYRKSGGSEKKLNKRPVLLSQIKDSTGKLVYPKIKFTDDSIAEGSTYEYCITGKDFYGCETKRTAPVEIKFPDQTPPPAPANFQLAVQKYNVTLTWDVVPVPDLKGFYIYRSTNDKEYQRISNEPLGKGKNQFIDKVSRKGGYYYFVSSVDNAGNETPSRRQFKDVLDVFPPSKPEGLTAKSDTGKIILKWKANTEDDLMGYLIFRQTMTKKGNGDFVLLNANPIKQNSFVNYLPKNTKNEFLYRIVAMDSSHNKSEYSNVAGAHMPDIKKPDKPYIKNISYVSDYVEIDWIANADADLKGYHLYRKASKDNQEPFKMINVNLINPSVTKYVDKWATPNTSYTYYLVAIDSTGNESDPSEYFEAHVSLKNVKNSSQVKNLKVQKKNKSIEAEWQLSTSPDFAGCVLFRGEEGKDLKPVSGMLQSGKFMDTVTDSVEVFYYQVKVYDKNGNKDESERVRFELKKTK
jgi:uncharacterized protein